MTKVEVQALVTDDAAVAEVKVDVAGFKKTFTGSSKRHPTDPVKRHVGEQLAIARALRAAAEELEADATAITLDVGPVTYTIEGNAGSLGSFFVSPHTGYSWTGGYNSPTGRINRVGEN